MWTKKFWQDASERMIRAFASGVIASTGAGVANIIDAGWLQRIDLGLGAAAVSLLFSLVGSKVSDPTSASLVNTEKP